MFDFVIAGAGFAGSVLAERLASQANKKVLVIDKRNHIGGNTYDFYNNDGILVHKYGPHIFHTNSREVFDYLSKFTEWRPYEHQVLASVDESTYSPDSKIKMGDHPVIWTNHHVAARNVYIFMGHGPWLFENKAFTTILRNAILWAAEKTPSSK